MDESIIGNVLSGLINKDSNSDGWNNGGWWIILLMIFWSGNGFGNWGNGANANAVANYATQQDITNGFNFNNMQQELQSLERGMCSSGYENAQLINGVNTAILGQTQQMSDSMHNITDGILTQTQQLGSAIADTTNAVNMVGCQTNHNIDNLRYEMAQNTCAINTNATANTQRILDRLCQMESNAKDNTIAQLRTDLQAAQLTLGNAAQTQNIVSALKPSPVPAYVVSSPYASYYTSGTTIA